MPVPIGMVSVPRSHGGRARDIRGAGGYQDGIVNGCHKTLNMLRYLAGIEATCNPKAVGVAQEIRFRARKILRNPVAHEFDEGRPW